MKVKKIIDSVVKPANLEAKTAVVKELLDYTGAYGRIPKKLTHQTEMLFGPDSDLLNLISNYNRVVGHTEGGEGEELLYGVLSGDPFDEDDETGDDVAIEDNAVAIHVWAAQHGVRSDNIPQWNEDREDEDIENDYKLWTHNKVNQPL
jgi:hypothetical protein